MSTGETTVRQDETVTTIDGEALDLSKAQATSRRMYVTGFALLPWMWVMNVWLFWPIFYSGGDPMIQTYTRRSAFGAALMFSALFVWMLAYCIGGESLYGKELFHKLDASRLNLD